MGLPPDRAVLAQRQQSAGARGAEDPGLGPAREFVLPPPLSARSASLGARRGGTTGSARAEERARAGYYTAKASNVPTFDFEAGSWLVTNGADGEVVATRQGAVRVDEEGCHAACVVA